MTNSEILSYVKTVAVNDISVINSYRLPVEGHYTSGTINGMSVLIPDLTMNSQYLKNYIYGTEIDESLALNPEYTAETDDGSETGSDYTYDGGGENWYQEETWYQEDYNTYTVPETPQDTSGYSYVQEETTQAESVTYDAGMEQPAQSISVSDSQQTATPDPAPAPAEPGPAPADTGAVDAGTDPGTADQAGAAAAGEGAAEGTAG
jgi:hypothetical protein